jgi:hypothetical protein
MSSSRLLNKAQPQLLAIQQSSRKIYMTVTRLPLRAESTDETVDHLRVCAFTGEYTGHQLAV